MKCSAIILAAGFSGRMGIPKFALRFSSERTFLQEVAEQYAKFGCNEIIVVLNEEGKELYKDLEIELPQNIKMVINHHPEYGRFYSLKTSMENLTNENSVFVHNVDNPFIDRSVLKLLFNGLSNADYCYPEYNGRGGHPVLLTGKVVKEILKEDDIEINLRDFLKLFEGNRIEVEIDKVLVNINTEEEYLRYF